MFHFPTFPPHALCVQARVTPHDWCGVPPFGNPRINARLTAPRGLSQPPTSFIGSWCQGIHRAPLTTWPHKNTAQHAPGRTHIVRAYKNSAKQSQKDARVHCAVLNVQPDTTHPTPPNPPPRRACGGTRCRTALTQEQRPRPGDHPPTGPLPQDPTACLRPDHPPPPRSPPTEAGRTRSSSSCRPNWSAFHPRAPPRQPAADRR